MSEQPSTQGGSEDAVVLGGRYRIHPDQPLPKLDSPLAKAVAASDRRAAARTLFALVCSPDHLPRVDVIPQISRLIRLPMLVPVDAGLVEWPEVDGRRFVVLFENMAGERVLPAPDARIEPLREDRIVRIVIRSLLPALKELSGRGIRHRAIRADNIFYADGRKSAAILGECVSAPAGFSQTAIYEPIDAAIARPSGRGPGTPADDLYAFGAMLVVLLAGGHPVPDKTEDEIIEEKISSGSYSALVGQLRVSLSMMEPLRGLLCDDPKERWTATDLELWLSGRQLSPKQPMLPTRAARSIQFCGREFWTRSALSFAMGRNWAQAGALVTSGELDTWLRRSLSDDESADSIEVARAMTGGSADAEDRMVSRALMVLEPTHPIRFRAFGARIESLTQAFAIEYNNPEIRSAFVDLMRTKLPQTYLQSQARGGSEHGSLMKTFDMMTHFIERPYIGSGVERAVYESNRAWPCQSPLVRRHLVSELEDLLPALEHTARRGGASGEPVDPHIAAFCMAKKKSLSHRVMKDLGDADDLGRFRLAVLRMLAEVQEDSGVKQRFPALSGWLAGLMGPVIQSYHNRAYRDRLVAAIARAGADGDLVALQRLLGSLEAQSEDANAFLEAQREHADLARGIAWLESGGLTSPTNVQAKSQQAATVLSAVLSGLTIVILALIYVT